MSWDQNAERMARNVYDRRNHVVSGQKQAKNEIGMIRQYWKGEGSDAFSGVYKRIDQEISQLSKKMSRLDQDLKHLARQIRLAENARRREAARQERQMKKKS